jgi:Acyl-CoA synthetases (AMP-forming)/AMP-acid ligases II
MVRLEKVILDNLRLEPEKPCLWWEGKWWTNGDLLRLVEESTKGLEKGGFRAGCRLAVLLPNSPLVLALSLSAWNLGGAISPLNAKSGLPSLMGTLDLVEPCAVVVAPGLDELKTALEEQDVPVVVAESLSAALPVFTVKETSLENDSLAVIFATSGTTGMPKAVPLTHGNLLDNSLMMYDALELLQEGDILLNVLPNFHSFGYTVAGLMPLVKKLRQTLVASFLPPVETMKTIHDSGTNVIVAVPTMLYFMTVGASKGAPMPVSLWMIVTGGRPAERRSSTEK